MPERERRLPDRIREVAPGLGVDDRATIHDILGDANGNIMIQTAGGQYLGSIATGGENHYVVEVSVRGISRGSGGELYELTAIQGDNIEHYAPDSILNGHTGSPTDAEASGQQG